MDTGFPRPPREAWNVPDPGGQHWPFAGRGAPGRHCREAWLLQPESSRWDGSRSTGLRTRARCPLHQAPGWGKPPSLLFFDFLRYNFVLASLKKKKKIIHLAAPGFSGGKRGQVPRPGTEPRPLHWEHGRVLSHWSTTLGARQSSKPLGHQERPWPCLLTGTVAHAAGRIQPPARGSWRKLQRLL